jgi:hypothetical protein
MRMKVAITNAELEDHLNEQLHFLESSAGAFDKGFDGEAKRLAVAIRVLVHDTSKSRSLLGQLGRLQSQKFVDTALPEVPGNVGTYSGLLSISADQTGAKYTPHLDDVPAAPRQIDFPDWWTNQPVFIDSAKRKFSRKDLVLAAANQDGGAHVDPALDESYMQLSKKNSLNWFSGQNGKDFVPIPAPERVAIRQIAHEILKTLMPSYGKKISRPGLSIAGVGFQLNVQPAGAPPRKMRRNEPCYCGSGKKYKHCHGRLP